MQSFRSFLEAFGDQYPPQMRYEGDDSPRSVEAWQDRLLAKLEDLSGEPFVVRRRDPSAEPSDPAVEIVGAETFEDHVREHVLIESVLGTQAPAYVLVPTAASQGPRPGVLALHGHTMLGKDGMAGVVGPPPDRPPYDIGRALVRAGFVVVCPDWWGWGERQEPGFEEDSRDMCNVKFMAAGMYGVPLLSIMIRDGFAALDVLLRRPEVDGARIGVIGNSFGGRMSMWLAAFDQRIRAAVCSGCLNCFRERSLGLTSCGAQFLPGMLRFGDVEDVFGLIAPRALMIMTGAADALIPQEYVVRMKPVIERVYTALGARDALTFHDHDGGHVLLHAPAVEWLTQHLA